MITVAVPVLGPTSTSNTTIYSRIASILIW